MWGCCWLTDLAGIQVKLYCLFEADLLRNIFHHTAGTQVVFFAGWGFIKTLAFPMEKNEEYNDQ